MEEFSLTFEFAVELLIADKRAAEADDKLPGVRVGGGGMREDKVLGKDEESHNPEGPYSPLAKRSSQNFFISIEASTFGVVAISDVPDPEEVEWSAAIPEDIDSLDSFEPLIEFIFLDVVLGLE